MFSNAVKLFSLNGFDIKLDPSWFLIAALVTWSLSQQYFPSVMPDKPQQTYVVMAVFAMLCFFASLLLHELAHSVVARRYGVPIKGITLFLFGGVAELEAEPQQPSVELWVAIAGPIMSFALSLGFWVLAQLSDVLLDAVALTHVLSYLALINLVLAVFNLVPAFPLDGGRVLRAFIWKRTGDILQATETAARSGTVFAYVLMGLGVFALFQGALVTGLWQIMIGAFLAMAARASYQSQLARIVFDDKPVSALMTRNPIAVSPDSTLSEFVNRVMLQHGVAYVPVVEGDVLLGHMDQTVLSGIDRENWGSTRVGDVFAGLDQTKTVPADFPVQDLMGLISKTGQRKFLVVDDHHLVGLISLSDLTRYLRMSELLRHAGP